MQLRPGTIFLPASRLWCRGEPFWPGRRSFFKSRLRLDILFRMERARLQTRQAELVEPFADCMHMHLDRKPARHFGPDVHASPADHVIFCRIRSLDDQLSQLGLLLLRQGRHASRRPAGFQALHAAGVVAMHPIARRVCRSMPLSAAASLREWPSRTRARVRRRRTCAPSAHLLDSARRSELVWSIRVMPNAALIQGLRHANRIPEQRIAIMPR